MAENIKETIITMIREIIQRRNWQTGKAQLTDWDLILIEAFQLKGGHNPNQVITLSQLQVGERNWKLPPEGSLKLNFDEASKGNPGRTCIGGAIRDSQGKIIQLYTRSLGNSTNNTAEFGALETGLEILHREGMTNIVVEGYSILVINTVRKLQNDTKVGNIQQHWHLAYSPQKIQEHLQTGTIMELRWIRMSTNGLADRISNEGVDKEGSEMDSTWNNILNGQFQIDCTQLAAKDYDGSRSTGDHIEARGTELIEGQVGYKHNPIGHLLNTSYNEYHNHTTRGSMTPQSCQ
jgi:ribonuclease HI